MIPAQTIEEIRNKADIVAVVSEYVKLKKTGKNYVGLCPFHAERTPSFTVSPEKRLFHCFGCGEGGNIFAFVMKTENIGFADAVRELGEKVNIAVEKSASSAAGKTEKDKLYEVLLLAQRFFRSQLEGENGAAARGYLKQREITEAVAKLFGLGFAPPEWDSLFKHLISRGAPPVLIERAGLTLPREQKDNYYDRFRSRLTFPVFDLRGRVIAFSGRALSNDEPKYMNSPETAIYHKGESVFGLNLTKEYIKKEKLAVLVEGNLDLLSSYQSGVKNVAAPLGTALTAAQCKILSRFAETIVLAFDSDSAGGAAAERSVELLRGQGLRVKVAVFSSAKDPDELIRKEGAGAFVKAIASALPFLEFKTKRVLSRHNLSEIEDRARALREVAGVLGTEADDFIQKEYARMAAGMLKLDAETVLSEIKKHGFYRRGQDKDLRRVTEKPASKVIEAEKVLIALAAQNRALRQALKEELRIEAFSLPEAKAVAELLFTAETGEGEDVSHFLLDNLPDDASRSFFSGALINEGHQEMETVFRDCLQVIKSKKKDDKFSALKSELRESEMRGDTDKSAALLSALKNEIS